MLLFVQRQSPVQKEFKGHVPVLFVVIRLTVLQKNYKFARFKIMPLIFAFVDKMSPRVA